MPPRIGPENLARLFCTNFLNSPRGLGHPSQIPTTSQIPSFKTKRKSGRERTFQPPPIRVEEPHPTWHSGPKRSILVLFSLQREIETYSIDQNRCVHFHCVNESQTPTANYPTSMRLDMYVACAKTLSAIVMVTR